MNSVKKRKYFIPKGGLFEFVWCPHYLCELIALEGIALISNHLNFWTTQACYILWLSGRAIDAKKWYKDKFGDKCPNRKAIFPYIL